MLSDAEIQSGVGNPHIEEDILSFSPKSSSIYIRFRINTSKTFDDFSF